MRIIVVGGGILGVATARLLHSEASDSEVVVIEKEPVLALHQTGSNSGVVHAGIYYTPGSLKARLCRRGVGLLRDYCTQKGLPYEECGKVVVALGEGELEPLDRLEERATANGVPGLRRLDETALREIEPHAGGTAALHSPTTAITDFRQVTEAMAAEVRAAGGVIRTSTSATRIRRRGDGVVVELEGGETVHGDRAVVCAGLHADVLARASGESATPRIIPFRGEYWQLQEERRDLVRGLIYPVPDPSMPFLGVHLTRKIDGSVLIGPNAVLAFAREGYRATSFSGRELGETLAWGGTWRMMRQNWRAGYDELARSASKRRFIGEARRYVPDLRAADAIRAGAGVRAQAVDRDGTLVDDFRLGGDSRVVWVRNAPSPAATSSMAIAELILESALGN